MSHLYFNGESDYSEENTCHDQVFHSATLHHRKKLDIFTLQLLIYYIQYSNRKSQLVQMWTLQKLSKKIVCLGCREVDAIVIASAKIPECEGSILPSSFYGQLPDY